MPFLVSHCGCVCTAVSTWETASPRGAWFFWSFSVNAPLIPLSVHFGENSRAQRWPRSAGTGMFRSAVSFAGTCRLHRPRLIYPTLINKCWLIRVDVNQHWLSGDKMSQVKLSDTYRGKISSCDGSHTVSTRGVSLVSGDLPMEKTEKETNWLEKTDLKTPIEKQKHDDC